jgi:hypothetical protein
MTTLAPVLALLAVPLLVAAGIHWTLAPRLVRLRVREDWREAGKGR